MASHRRRSISSGLTSEAMSKYAPFQRVRSYGWPGGKESAVSKPQMRLKYFSQARMVEVMAHFSVRSQLPVGADAAQKKSATDFEAGAGRGVCMRPPAPVESPLFSLLRRMQDKIEGEIE